MEKQRSLSKILKEAMSVCIIEIGSGLPGEAKRRVAIKAGVSLATVHRYLRLGVENRKLWEALSEVLDERKLEAEAMAEKAGIDFKKFGTKTNN